MTGIAVEQQGVTPPNTCPPLQCREPPCKNVGQKNSRTEIELCTGVYRAMRELPYQMGRVSQP
jgi:hypothetical protein